MIAKAVQRGSLVATVVAAGLAGYAYVMSSTPVAAVDAAGASKAPAAEARPVGGAIVDFSDIVDRYGLAVVNISVIGKAEKQSNPFEDIDPNDPFFEFFRRFGHGFQIPKGQTPAPRGQGSGFIIGDDGLILTNAHVVRDAQEVTVRLTDRREFKAKIIGSDKQTDIAVLRISGQHLPTVRLGEPSAVRVGEPVLAIGSPFGFENSATSGIVSAKSRSLPDETFVPFIQTDVAVNPGNSGGPLFNARGEVIGINSQIYSRTGGYQGLSFAIPIDVAIKVKDQILKHGRVTRGRIGVAIQEVNQQLAESFGLEKPMGALVSSVETGAPADKAGLLAGDIIVAVNGRAVGRSSELPALIGELPPGSKANLEVIRQGGKKQISVDIVERKEDGEKSATGRKDKQSAAKDKLGLSVRPLTSDEQRQVKTQGLLVEDVEGPALQAGIRPGDVILAVNGNRVATLDQFATLVNRAGKRLALLIQRDRSQLFVPIDLG